MIWSSVGSPFFSTTAPANANSFPPAEVSSSRSHKYTDEIPPSKYISRYVSKALFKDTSSWRSLEDGIGPDVAVGRYSFDHGDLASARIQHSLHQRISSRNHSSRLCADLDLPEAIAVAVVVASEKVFAARLVLQDSERLVDIT